jgi:uncharacterized membrane protein YeaQ/YmgE (transglycosylase-associated protein family)
MYEPRNSIRQRTMRVAQQRGLIGEGAGVLPLVLLAVVVIGVIWLSFAVAGLVFSLIPTLLIGLIAGWAGSRLVGVRMGTGWTLLAGIVGSLVGGPLINLLLPGSPVSASFFNPLQWVASVLGAAIVITLARVVARPALTGADRPRLGRY